MQMAMQLGRFFVAGHRTTATWLCILLTPRMSGPTRQEASVKMCSPPAPSLAGETGPTRRLCTTFLITPCEFPLPMRLRREPPCCFFPQRVVALREHMPPHS